MVTKFLLFHPRHPVGARHPACQANRNTTERLVEAATSSGDGACDRPPPFKSGRKSVVRRDILA